jgi:hypothetical protein
MSLDHPLKAACQEKNIPPSLIEGLLVRFDGDSPISLCRSDSVLHGRHGKKMIRTDHPYGLFKVSSFG